MTWVSTTVIACIQRTPTGGGAENAAEGGVEALPVQELTATAEDYLAAVAAAEAQVPDGWRVLYVRAEDAPMPPTSSGPAPAGDPSEGSRPEAEATDDSDAAVDAGSTPEA